MSIESVWPVDKDREANFIYSTRDQDHAGVKYLYKQYSEYFIGGSIKGIQLPIH